MFDFPLIVVLFFWAITLYLSTKGLVSAIKSERVAWSCLFLSLAIGSTLLVGFLVGHTF